MTRREVLQHDKGFGFVTPDGGAAEVFVHATVLEKERQAVCVQGRHKGRLHNCSDRREGGIDGAASSSRIADTLMRSQG